MGKRKILIADDLGGFCIALGAGDGDEAIGIALDQNLGTICMDTLLPKLDGISPYYILKSDAKRANITGPCSIEPQNRLKYAQEDSRGVLGKCRKQRHIVLQ